MATIIYFSSLFWAGIWAVIAIITLFSNFSEIEPYTPMPLVVRVVSVVIFLGIAYLGIPTYNSFSSIEEPRLLWTEELANLADNTRVSTTTKGSFFLLAGSLSSEDKVVDVFRGYAKQSSGGFALQNYPAALSRIYFTDKTPMVEVWGPKYTPSIKLFGFIEFTDPEKWHVSEYRIYVPEGSITQEYLLDAK